MIFSTTPLRVLCAAFLLASTLLMSFSVKADLRAANDWLLINSTGGDSVLEHSLSFTEQSESEALNTLESLNIAPRSELVALRKTVLENTLMDTESLSRVARHKARALQSNEVELRQLANRANILNNLTPNSAGIGTYSYYQGRALETSFAILALAQVPEYSALVERLLGSLLADQRDDGSFADEDISLNNLYVTAQALQALRLVRLQYGLDQPIQSALAAIDSVRQPDGTWGGVFETSTALLAVLPVSTNLDQYQNAVDDLKSDQHQNGSWQDDVYLTALAARAINASENVETASSSEVFANVQLTVVDAATGQVLSGVLARLKSFENGDASLIEVSSDPSGMLVFEELTPLTYSLVLTLEGYLPRTLEFSPSAGETLSFGAVTLVKPVSTVSGSVRSFDDNTPIENAIISVAGATASTTNSAIDGSYRLNVEPGQIVVSISADGFDSVAAQGLLAAGGSLTFSPLLRAESSTPPAVEPSGIRGRIVNQLTGDGLEFANVEILGSDLSVSTNSDGIFEFMSVEPGDISILIGKDGFSSREVSLLVPESTTVNVGDISVLEQSEPLKSSISGRVVNADGISPLEGVTVTFAQQTLSTASDGSFSFTNQDAGDYSLSMSKSGYLPVEFSITLDPSTSLQLTDIPLNPEVSQTPLTESTLQGLVSDATTNNPISNAQVLISPLGLIATTDSQGLFEVSGINLLEFDVSISAAGYAARVGKIESAQFEIIEFSAQLSKAIAPSAVSVASVSSDRSNYGSYEQVDLDVILENTSDRNINTTFYIKVTDHNGVLIEERPEALVPVGGNIADNFRPALSGQETQYRVLWFSQALQAGDYTITVQALSSNGLVVLAENATTVTIDETKAVSGLAKFDPPLAQLAAQQEIELSTTIMNRGNVDIPAGTLSAKVILKNLAESQLSSKRDLLLRGSVEGIQGAVAMDTDKFGNTYIVSSIDNAIIKITPSGVTEELVSNVSNVRDIDVVGDKIYVLKSRGVVDIYDGQLNKSSLTCSRCVSANSIEVTEDQKLFLGNRNTIFEVFEDGSSEELIGVGLGAGYRDIVKDTSGALYFSDSVNDAVYKLSNETLVKIATINGAHGLASDSQNNIYVTTLLRDGLGQLLKIDAASGEVQEIAGGLSEPYDVHVENDGISFLVTNSQSHEILRISAAGEKQLLKSGSINNPTGLVYDPASDNLIVLNTGFSDIREFESVQNANVVAQNIRGSDLFIDAGGDLNLIQAGDIFKVTDQGETEKVVDFPGATTDAERFGENILAADSFGRTFVADQTGELSLFSDLVLNFRSGVPLKLDSENNLYTIRASVANALAESIVKISPDGTYNIFPTGLSGKIVNDLALNATGDFYLLNSTDRTIEKYQEGAQPFVIAQLGFRPDAFAFDEDKGRFLVSQSNSTELSAVDIVTGEISIFANLSSRLRARSKIVIDSMGDFWLLNQFSNIVKVSGADGSTQVFESLGRYNALAFNQGSIYGVSIAAGSGIFKISLDGETAEQIAQNSQLSSTAAIAVSNEGQLFSAKGVNSDSEIRMVDLVNGETLLSYESSRGLLEFAVSGTEIVAIKTLSVIEVRAGKVPRTLASERYTHIASTDLPNEYALTGRNKVVIFNSRTKETVDVASGFDALIALAVSDTGEISIAESSPRSRLIRLNRQGAVISTTSGIVTPTGIIVDTNGQIVFGNTRPSNLLTLQGDHVLPYADTRHTSVRFINQMESDNRLYFPRSSAQIVLIDPDTKVSQQLSQKSLFGSNASLINNLIYDGVVAYGVGGVTGSGTNAILKLNQQTKEVQEFGSGLGILVDLESQGVDLFALDQGKKSVLNIENDGSSQIKFNRIEQPHGMFISEDGAFHVSYFANHIAVFNPVTSEREDFNFRDTLPVDEFSRIFDSLVYVNDRYYLMPGTNSSPTQNRSLFFAEFSSATSQEYEVGSVLYSTTQAVEALAVDSNSVKFDFGAWVPPIGGDFVLEVTHSEAENTLSNSLHVGGSASGVVNLSDRQTFPGDRLLNGSLQVIGADFSTISQINTDGVSLAAESMANGRAIAGDSKGNIYAANGSQLIKVSADGERTVFAEGFPIGQSLAVDDFDNIYAVSGQDVVKLSPDGNSEVLASLVRPVASVIVDYDNQVFAADSSGIFKISPNGDVESFKSISSVRALSRDRYGNTYVLNARGRIFKILPDGSISPYFDEASFEYEGVNMVNDCSDNVLFAPTRLDPFKTGGEEDIVVQVSNGSREAGVVFFGPEFDTALGDIDVLYYDRINQQMLMYSDFSNGKIFSFPIVCGGIDVDVTVVTRDDVDLSASNPSPTSEIDLGNGQTKFIWNLDQVANTGENIELKYFFKNLKAGETRPALEQAYLEFTNTFVPDQTIKVPLAIPSVDVGQPVALNVELDKQEYQAFEPLQITHNVVNLTDANFDGSVNYQILDDNADIVAEFETLAINDLTAFEDRLINSDWNTEQTIVGSYTLLSILLDSRGNEVTRSSDTFTVTDSLGATNIGLRLTTDRVTYNVSDSVQLDSLVSNRSLNAFEPSAELELTVRNVNGDIVFEKTASIGDLTTSYSNLFIDLFDLSNAVQGEYTATGRVLSQSGQILASASNTFDVKVSLQAVLTGAVQVSDSSVEQGAVLTCTDTVTNSSNIDLTDAGIRQLLVRIDNEQLIDLVETQQLLLANQSQPLLRTVDTADLSAGIYACSLQAVTDAGITTLATEVFEVTELQTPIEVTLDGTIGDKGRVLVLLDESGNAGTSPQTQFLQELLLQFGWLHTLTSSVDEFERELETNSHTNYVLLAANNPLSDQALTLLSDAVSRGAGLIDAGNASQRQPQLDQLLGLQFVGQSSTVQGISLQDSALQAGGSLTFASPNAPPLASLNGAISVASYVPDAIQNGQSAPAITLNSVEDGRAVYIGFDVLEEAQLINDPNNEVAAILLNALNYVTPSPALNFIGNAVPVSWQIHNVGAASPSQWRLALPEGVEFVGGMSPQPDSPIVYDSNSRTLTHNLSLEAGQSLELTVWLSAADNATLTAVILSGQEPEFIEQDSAEVELTVQAIPEVVDTLGVAQSFNAFMCDDFTSRYSDAHAGIAAGGNVSLDSYGVASRLPSQPTTPTLIAGGDLFYGQGKIFVGSGLVGGSAAGVNPTVTYGLENGAFIQDNAAIPFDFEAEFARLKQLSSSLAAVPSTGTIEYKYGGIYLAGDCSSDAQVFNLDGAIVLNSNHLVLSCVPNNATLIFNIDGKTAGFRNIGLSQLHSRAPNVLYNFHEAETVQFTWVGIEGSVLAPNAHFDNPRGQVNGTVIGKSWNGPMELHDFKFSGSLKSVLDNVLNGAQPSVNPQ